MNKQQIAVGLLKLAEYGSYGAMTETQKKPKTFKPVTTKVETPSYDTSYIGYKSSSMSKVGEYSEVRDMLTIAKSKKKAGLAQKRIDASQALRKINDGRR